ncbi:hypothetical protein [Poritiphilus flavus]|uniref:Lipoprotein n=1 Tax=Poritiphilus flavus TaxID=2697053 RepID=A0A6L9EI26_9FLAO|nr:hypothetical protein [Poritiphilus flavus]NAS14391.1 hypothetical protein [Poritiphilus flavus]
MYKIRCWVLLAVVALAAACNFTEEIFLEEDGSGKISINFDGSELMEMAGEEMAQTNEKPVDSIISFKDFLEEKKDSIATLSPEEQAKLKKLEPFNLHMIMNPETGVMKFDMYSEFKEVGEVSDAFNAFQNASAIGPNSGAQDSPINSDYQSSEVNYTFKDNTFKRTARITDSVLHQMSLDSLQGAEMFLSGSTYTLKYHFPKRVKSASAEEATFSADGKTMIYTVKFLDYMKDPEALNISVELEK